MKTPIVFFVLAAVTLAPLTGPFTATVLDSVSPPQSADTMRPISDQTAEAIRGALAWKWKCAIVAASVGAGLFAAAFVTAGGAAIAAPFLLNAAAFCLI